MTKTGGGIHVGDTFVWTSPAGRKHDFRVERTTIGVDTGHVLARRSDTGDAYRVAKSADGRRLSGAPARMGGKRKR